MAKPEVTAVFEHQFKDKKPPFGFIFKFRLTPPLELVKTVSAAFRGIDVVTNVDLIKRDELYVGTDKKYAPGFYEKVLQIANKFFNVTEK